MGENNRNELVNWRVSPAEDEKTGAVGLWIWGRGEGVDVAAAPIRAVSTVPGGFEVEVEDGSIFLVLLNENAWPRVFGKEKKEWYRLVRKLDSFDLKCFACFWMEDLYLYSEEEYHRDQCMEWAERNGLDPGAWKRIRAMRMAADREREPQPSALEPWNEENALRIDLSAFCRNYYHCFHEGKSKARYEHWEYPSRRLEAGKEPLVTICLKWKDDDSPKGTVFQLQYRIRGVNCLEILGAKMLPWVELQWVHSVDEPEMEHTHFRFRLWEHVYLCNVGETPLLLTGAVSGEPLKPGELRELNVDFCS